MPGVSDFVIKHNIHFLEPWNMKLLRACIAEFIAMAFFVTLCCGCAMVTFTLSNPNIMMIAASFGYGIMILAQFVGPLSGGHINCAVSFALWIGGRISFLRFVLYMIFQMAGAILGALILQSIFGTNWPQARAFGANSWDEGTYNGGQVFFAEMLGTMLLVFNVFSTVDIPKEGGGALGVYPIAMSVMVAHLFLIPIDGCSINPTRSYGPYLVAEWAGIGGDYRHQQYMFWLAPMIGAALAAAIYEYGSLKPENFAGAGDMMDSIYQSNKKRDKDLAEQMRRKLETKFGEIETKLGGLTDTIRLRPNAAANSSSSDTPTPS